MSSSGKKRGANSRVLVEVSARHVHLSEKDASKLFGKFHNFSKLRKLSQPGEYSARETLTLFGKKRTLHNCRVMMPPRRKSQVELSITDCYSLGIRPVLRLSGKTFGAPKILVQGPRGNAKIPVIIAKRHLHLSKEQAKKLKIRNKQELSVSISGKRALIFSNVTARISEESHSKYPILHLDTDEANSAMIKNRTIGKLHPNPHPAQ
jgi:putative phosphotransacetylase